MKKIALLIAFSVLVFSIQAKPRFITYEKYGAKGDGVTDDMPAIVAAHAAANAKGLPVKATAGKTYYISNAPLTAEIRTDTDFGNASFIIDDVGVEEIRTPVFKVCADKEPFDVKGVQTLYRGQTNLGVGLPCRCLVEVINNDHKVFIRKGLNQNAGAAQKEVLLVSEDGSNFSGGEKKRICLARALLRHTDVLILDEPLANLDAATAEKIEDLLLSIKNKTLLVVSHQFTAEKLSAFDSVINFNMANS